MRLFDLAEFQTEITLASSSDVVASRRVLRTFVKLAFLVMLVGIESTAGAEEAVPVLAPAEPVLCVFKDLVAGETCPAYSSSRAVEIQGVGGETVLFVEKESLDKNLKPERASIVASSRIEDAVALEEYDADDAVLLEREVRELSGARYELPSSRSEIKRMVGFPDDAEVAKEDWIEMLRVHAEMAMSLSANASQFILDQLGLVSDPPARTNAETLDGSSR